ncbi:MAG: methyltransferase domain-containing protein [Nitrospirae bacterium]|nr:MAG: methyltransferase domain-containing protein [Nitrospirota bacterium]
MSFLFGIIALLVVATVVWLVVSRRQSLPCPVWLRWCVELDNPFAKNNRAAVILDHLDLQPGMTVLDLGCGPGRLTVPAAQRVGSGGRVVAMDLQAGMLARAKEKAHAANLSNIEFIQAGAGEEKLGRGRFDRALLVTVLGEIPDRTRTLKEIFDALKPSGILSVTETLFDPHYQSRQTVARLAGEVGFRERGCFGNRLAYTVHLEKPTNDAHAD